MTLSEYLNLPASYSQHARIILGRCQSDPINHYTKKEIKGTPTPGEKVEISEVKIETTLTLKEGETAVLMRTPAKDAPSVITTVNARVMPAPAPPAVASPAASATSTVTASASTTASSVAAAGGGGEGGGEDVEREI